MPAVATAKDCPKTTLGDIEDEVMCPVCGTPLGLASESPQAQRERAYIERLIAQCRSKDEVKQALVAEFGDSVLALPGDEGDDGLGDVLVYVVPALGIVLAGGRDRVRRDPLAAPAASGPGRHGHGRRRPRSRTTWSATTCDRPAVGRRHHLRRLRRRLHLVRLALRAPAGARLPLDHLGRLVRRHPGGQGARAGARARPSCSASRSRSCSWRSA